MNKQRILPSQLTDDEILSLLNSDTIEDQDSKQDVFQYTGDIVPFLSEYNITPGKTEVSKKLIYKLYKIYSKNPLDRVNFTKQIGSYISHNNNNFFINIDQFAISQHIYKAEKTRDKTKSISYQKHFTWFIQESETKPGSVWIEGFILFQYYKDFCRERRVTPRFGYINFHKFLKLHFNYKRIKENRSLWFRVDYKTATKYSEKEREQIRNSRSKETGRSKKKGKPKTEETKT